MKKAKTRKLLLLISILPAMLLAGCSKEEEQVVLESVSITDAGVQMKVGEEHQLEFSYLPSGIERPAAQWMSSNSTVATVNADGLVKAMKEGTATITLTATSQGIVLTDECTITVTNVEATAITLSENTLELKAGETFDLHYTIEPENTTVKDVEWSTSNEKVATVNKGTVTATGAGEAEITVTVSGTDISATCKVSVEPVEVEAITLSESQIVVENNRTYTLTAEVLPNNATDKTLLWSSSDETVATVEDGIVTAHKVGKCTISVKSANGKVESKCEVEVIPVKVTGIQVHDIDALLVGDKVKVVYEVFPTDAANKNVTITSDNTAAVSVEGEMLSANSIGMANITVTTEDGEFSSTIAVHVTDITSMMELRMSFSGTNIMGYHSGWLYSYITNNSSREVTLTKFEIIDSMDERVVASTEDASLLGTLSPGETKNLGTDNLTRVYNPIVVWHFTYNGESYQISQMIK